MFPFQVSANRTKHHAQNIYQAYLKRVSIMTHLDDWLTWESSPEECKKDTHLAIKFITKWGFLMNETKLCMTPSSCFKWLGVSWDTQSVVLSLPVDKTKKIKKDLRKFVHASRISRYQVERVLSSHQFASLIDALGKATLKDVNHHLLRYVTSGCQDTLCVPPQPL